MEDAGQEITPVRVRGKRKREEGEDAKQATPSAPGITVPTSEGGQPPAKKVPDPLWAKVKTLASMPSGELAEKDNQGLVDCLNDVKAFLEDVGNQCQPLMTFIDEVSQLFGGLTSNLKVGVGLG